MAVSVRFPTISIRPIQFNMLNNSSPPNLKNTISITNQQQLGRRRRRIRNLTIIKAIEKKREETESSEIQQLDVSSSSVNESESETKTGEVTELGAEIKKAMEERRKKEMETGGNFWNGVLEEVKEIEWPAFGKAVGTTGVVLGVIAGSSVVLLTVNAVLAELSDRVLPEKVFRIFSAD